MQRIAGAAAWKTMAPVLVAALAIAALAQGVRALGVNCDNLPSGS
jgi:hypothetical protein